MSDGRFTQSTLHAPRIDQTEAIHTYQSGMHLLNYAYPAQHSGIDTIDALLPEQEEFSVWDTSAAGTIIPYSFIDPVNAYFDSASYGSATDATTRGVYRSDILELSDDQKNAIRMGLTEWARYIDVEFVEVLEENNQVGLLRFGGTSYSEASGYAWAYYPNWYYAAGGDTWFSPSMMRNADWSQGTYEYLTIIHEIGHALSLAHSHDGHEMTDALDDVRYTIMSYNNYDSQVAQWINGQIVHYAAYTPMVYDIQAAQYLYGANTTTEIGSTTYTFAPATPRVQAIYDSGGIDTFDLTAFTLRNIVDLSPGASSTLGFTHHIDDNTAIAFGSIVENIRSGSGADDLFGNDVENAIYGGAGDDLLHGEDGNDTLLGEADHDTIYGGSGDDLISGGTGEDHLNDAWGDDSLSGEDGADTIIAHLGENTLSGGDADDFLCAGFGNDQLIGGSGDDLILADFPHRYARGNDTLIGGEGDDKLDGGLGADDFVFFAEHSGSDTIGQFDPDGTLNGAGFNPVSDRLHLITGSDGAETYSLQNTTEGTVLVWGTCEILIVGVDTADFENTTILVEEAWI